MSFEILSNSKPRARKKYPCDASAWLDWDAMSMIKTGEIKLSFAERRALIIAQRKSFTILPGELYVKQVNKFDGSLNVFRAIPEIHSICSKHNIYNFDY